MKAHMRTNRVGLLSLALALLITPGTPSTHGARQSVTSRSKIQPQTLRVAFGVDKTQGTITEVIDTDYLASPDNGIWLIPLSSPPLSVQALDVSVSSLFDVLSYTTRPRFDYGVDYCAYMVPSFIVNNSGDNAGNSDVVSQLDYGLIYGDTSSAVIAQLRAYDYQISTQTQPIIAQYLKAGDIFLVLHFNLSQNDSGQAEIIPPIAITYRSNTLTLPVRLDAVSTDHDLNILTWIFADTQYVPANYKHVPLSVIPQDVVPLHSEIADMAGIDRESGYPESNPTYQIMRQRISQQIHKQVFITDYAHPNSSKLALPSNSNSPQGYAYVTRLNAVIPRGTSVDPVFVPAPSAADIPDAFDLMSLADPLALWGCTTQAIAGPKVVAEFAHSHTTYPDLRFTVGYPAGWVLSKLTQYRHPLSTQYTDAIVTQPIYAYAPATVTNKTLDDFFNGEHTPPMFIFAPVSFSGQDLEDWNWFYNLWGSPQTALLDAIAFGSSLRREIPYAEQRHAIGISFQPLRSGDKTISIVTFGILANDQDWQTNDGLFHDMINYAAAHLYNLGSNQRDSLFLSALVRDDYGSGIVTNDVFELPIPDGWIAHTDANSDLLITPHGAIPDATPTMRLTALGYNQGIVQSGVLLSQANNYPPHPFTYPMDTIKRVLDFYGLQGNPEDDAIKTALTTCTDPAKLAPTPFRHNGQTGFVLLNSDYIVGIYAPDVDFAQYKEMLQTMLSAYIADYKCAAVLESTR